jgi:hypothetical protein
MQCGHICHRWQFSSSSIYKLANHVVESDSLNKFKPQHLFNTVWAFATAQVSDPKLFEKVAKAAIQRKEEFDSQGIANLTNSCSCAKLIDTYIDKDLSQIALAYAVADIDAPTLFYDDFINKVWRRTTDLLRLMSHSPTSGICGRRQKDLCMNATRHSFPRI